MVVIWCPVGTVADLQSDSILVDGYFGRDTLGVCGGAQLWLAHWYHWGCEWTSVKKGRFKEGSEHFWIMNTFLVAVKFGFQGFHNNFSSIRGTCNFEQYVGYSTWGVAPLFLLNRHESDSFMEAFSSQAIQATNHLTTSSRDIPPAQEFTAETAFPIPFFVEHPSTGYDLEKIVNSWTSIQNIIVQGAKKSLTSKDWSHKKRALQPDSIFCCDLVRHPALRGGFHWVFDDIGGRNSD